MKNFEKLKAISMRRQVGYTSALKTMTKGKIIAMSVISAKQIGDNAIAAASVNIDTIDEPIIPDNDFLFIAVKEASDRIEELEKQIEEYKFKLQMINSLFIK